MKTSLFIFVLITACSLNGLAAQKKKRQTLPKSTKSDILSKTRERRTTKTEAPAQTAEPKATEEVPTASEPAATPQADGEKPASSADSTVTEAVSDTKPAENFASPNSANESGPADQLADLRAQIDAAASGPERNRLRLKLADELLSSGKRSEAVAELQSIVNTDVFDPQGFYNAGNAFARLGETDGAVDAYHKAIDQRKGKYSRAFNNLGVVLLRDGRWDEAYDALSAALKLEGFRYAEASYNLGRLYAARGQSDLATREWKRVLKIDPDHTGAAEALAGIRNEDRVVVRSSKSGSRQPEVVAAKKRSTSDNVSVETGSKLEVKKPSNSSRPSAPLVLDQASYEFLQRARTSSEKGNMTDAINSYKRVLAKQGGYFAPANLELSYALLSLKQYDEALSNLQKVADRDGARYPISYYHLARICELKGDLTKAEALFSRAATVFDKQNGQFLLDVSRVREKQGNFQGALEAMEQYLALMHERGQEPSWSNERLTSLREKIASAPKN